MAIQGVNPACYILALFIRDDGERFLLGSGFYEFKEKQMHFSANSIENDTISVQGNDGYLLAGQVRRPGSQDFNGFVGDGTVDKATTEQKRRDFFSFFRKNFFYKVVYVFPNGTAIQRKRGFLVDDPTVKELYQIYPEYHVALNFEDVNYYSYAEDDDGHEIYAKVAEISLTASAASGGLMWDTYGVIWEPIEWTDFTSATGGTDFSILSQYNNVPIDELVVQGDTFQQTYSGKNKFDYVSASDVNNTFISTYRLFEIDGLIPNTTYTISNLGFTSTLAGTYVYLWNDTAYTTSNKIVLADPAGYKSSASLGTSNGAKLYLAIYPTDDTTWENVITYFENAQVEEGSTATSYEPYVGGTASPNPQFPQQIQAVTGEQTVNVSGKNLLPFANINFNSSNVVFTSQDGMLKINGTANAPIYGGAQIYKDNLSFTLPAGTYTLSKNSQSPSAFIFTKDNNTQLALITDNSTTPVSFTLAQKTEVYLGFYIPNASAWNIQVKLQLEKGSATSYEPYQGATKTIDLGSTELCKIGTYQDYIYKSGDDWYVHKAIQKTILSSVDGEQNSAFIWYASPSALESSSEGTIIVASDLYLAQGTNFRGGIGNFRIAKVIGANQQIGIKDNRFANYTEFNTWLANNNLTLYYVLATPTDTKITDSDLIDDLNGLGALKLFAGNNMVTVTATGSNLPAPVQFKYATAYTSTGAVWEAGGPSGPTTVSVDSIAQVFPVWEVKGPAVNPQLSGLTTGTTIAYAGSVTSSQTLVIDMFNKTATLNGTSVVGNVTGDWISFKPGTNRVVYTTGNADAQPSLIKWQEIVG